MTAAAWLTLLAFLTLLTAGVAPLGCYIERVFSGKRTALSVMLVPVERAIYRLCRIDPAEEMAWTTYLYSILAVSLCGTALIYLVLRLQQLLPLNPQHFPSLSPDVAWNTAVSFVTTTDWQTYSGESALSYLSQMASLAWANFIAAAVGLAAAIAFFRSLAREKAPGLGNFWVDLTRSCLYVLLPLSVVGAMLFAWEGIPQNFNAYVPAAALGGGTQSITGGPMASQEIIKLLGGNGGGFVGANSASPNENPSAFCNLLELLAMFLIPAALTYTYGRMVGDRRQGWALYVAMSVLFVAGVVGASYAESAGNPLVHALGVQGGNMEGKEVRFGVGEAGISIAVATDSTNGAANLTYDSLMPLGGLVAMADIQTSEVIFGGVGSGILGMVLYVILTVFIAGLMVGRTPEWLGKKIERREITFVMIAVLTFPLAILLPAAVAVLIPPGLATLGSAGPHGFSEILYAFTSVTGSNGSAFAGLGPNLFYTVVTGASMLVGRFAVLIPTLAIAGTLAVKPRNVIGRGTFSTSSPLFVILLIGVVVIVGALTFLPADALGPIVEHLLMLQGKTT
jgi:potassium-transporting ATPase potassium-binding subunit